MGLYNDHRNFNRESWEFTYKGSQLLPLAERKRDIFRKKELKAREEIGQLMADSTVSAKDNRIAELQSTMEQCGEIYEKCLIWCWEFSRRPEQEYVLKLGDVSFFDIPEDLSKRAQKELSK